MIIDIHTHSFPEKIAASTIQKLSGLSHTIPFTDGTEEGIRRTSEACGIDLSVVLPVATAPQQVKRINAFAAQKNETWRETGILSFAAAHPDDPDALRELDDCKERGFPGIKIHPVYQNADLDDIRYLRILYRAAELGLLVVTHSGLDVGYPGAERCSPGMIRHVCQEVGDLPLIAAHMGGWRNWEEVPELLSDTGVYLDTSFSVGSMHPLNDGWYSPEDLPMLNAGQFMEMVRAFGAERILFGTDRPWSDPAECLAFIRDLPLPEGDKDAILGGNAERLPGLQRYCLPSAGISKTDEKRISS